MKARVDWKSGTKETVNAERREVLQSPSQVPELVEKEQYPCPCGNVDHGGRAGADVVSELDGALVELVRSLGSQDICLQNGREDERVLGVRLAAAEVIREHVGMLLLQESKLRPRLGPQIGSSGRECLGAGTRVIVSSIDH